MNQINLLGDNNQDSDKKSFAVNVDDHDVKLPEDLTSSNNSAGEFSAGFEFGKYKNWLLILGGTILIFVAVIFSLSSSSSEIQERLEATDVAVEQEEGTENIPSFFMGSLANLPSGEVPDSELDDFDDEEDEDPFDFFNDQDVEDDFGFSDDDDDEDPFDFFNESDFFNSADEDDSVQENEDSDIDLEQLFGRIEDVSTINNPTLPSSDGPSLGSNTTPETLMSGEMQGDTGPAIWLAFLPSVAYLISRRRRA